MSYPAEMRESLAKVEASRPRRMTETFPKLSPEERDSLLHTFHPDYISEAFRELRVGPNKGGRAPLELVNVLEASPTLIQEGCDLDDLLRQEPDAVCDVLVIGGGGAGASAALLAQENGADALICTKLRFGDANTMMAQGGIQAADKENDSPAVHYLDVMGGGGFVCDPDLVEALVMDAPKVIAWLESLGVKFVLDTWVGKDITIDGMLDGEFDAVFLGTGAGVGNEMGIEGEELEGVHSATDFLVRGNLPPEQLPAHLREPLPRLQNVVVIGGGDTSMDCVRTAIRLGVRNVSCVYRRTEAEMPGRAEERKNAREEGVRFEMLTLPVRIIGDENGRVKAVECQRMELGEPDESGRRRPVAVKGSEFMVPADAVVIAIGYGADPLVPQTTQGLQSDRKALIKVDHRGRTTRRGVFAGGDNVNGADLVVTALAAGRTAAEAIAAYLETLPPRPRR